MIRFGRYPAPIEWQVLERRADRVLVVSRHILDCRRYHDLPTATTWRDSTLRRWLNTTFLDAAFTAAEQRRIRRTRCTDNGHGTPDTVDRVFLLSVAQVRALTHPGEGEGLDRRAVATSHATARTPDGCHLYVYDKGVAKDYVDVDGERRGCSWWWLRTQPQAKGGTCARAAFVGARGDVKSYGAVDQRRCGVRPALLLDVSR